MKISLDDVNYELDHEQATSKFSGYLKSNLNRKIEFKNGPTIDLGSKSPIMSILREVCRLMLMPIISHACKVLLIDLPKKERHANSIEYVIMALTLLANKAMSMSVLSIKSNASDLAIESTQDKQFIAFNIHTDFTLLESGRSLPLEKEETNGT